MPKGTPSPRASTGRRTLTDRVAELEATIAGLSEQIVTRRIRVVDRNDAVRVEIDVVDDDDDVNPAAGVSIYAPNGGLRAWLHDAVDSGGLLLWALGDEVAALHVSDNGGRDTEAGQASLRLGSSIAAPDHGPDRIWRSNGDDVIRYPGEGEQPMTSADGVDEDDANPTRDLVRATLAATSMLLATIEDVDLDDRTTRRVAAAREALHPGHATSAASATRAAAVTRAADAGIAHADIASPTDEQVAG